MSRTFKKPESNGDFVVAPEGASPAVLITLACLGWHQSEYQGQSRNRELIGLVYELTEPADDGRALSVHEVLTLSFHEKAKLYQRVKALCGGKEPPDGFDLARLLKSPGCMLTITHRQDGDLVFANIEQASPLPRGMTTRYQPSVTPVYYDLLEHDEAVFEKLPKRFQRLIDEAQAAPAPPRQPAARQPAAPPRQPAARQPADSQRPSRGHDAPAAEDFDNDIPF